ncbi:hypothetical protein [Nostoc sp. LPT]|uniref:hypothetical protein n=1 Tax=Nostoc sp. LPT TaxID=2815387 RepID=UPI0025EA670A|nr:hypothetical protein [Nostoc sp. LPT]
MINGLTLLQDYCYNHISTRPALVFATQPQILSTSHHCEEEWIYILSGQAIAEIDGEEFEVFPGNFMA